MLRSYAATLYIAALCLALAGAGCGDAPEPAPEAAWERSMVTIGPGDALRVGDRAVTLATIGEVLREVTGGDFEQRIMVRVEKDVSYPSVRDVLNAMAAVGFRKVALVSEEVVQ